VEELPPRCRGAGVGAGVAAARDLLGRRVGLALECSPG